MGKFNSLRKLDQDCIFSIHRSESTPTRPSPCKSRSQSPPEEATSPASVVSSPPQPYLALPTNPIVIIPYSLIRTASVLPGPL